MNASFMNEVFPPDMTQWDAFSIITYRVVFRYLFFATIAFLVFYVVLKKPLWFRKIQKRLPRLSDYGRDIAYSVVAMAIFGVVATVALYRSEERRVGKEGRSRWSPYH